MFVTDELTQRAQAAYNQWRQDAPLGMAFDFETTGLAFHDEPFALTVAWGDRPGHYIDLRNPTGFQIAADMLQGTPALVAHNLDFDLQKAMLVGLLGWDNLPQLHDTQTLAHLIDEHQPLGLKALTRDVLGLDTGDEAALNEWFKDHKIKKADRRYDALPPEILMPYAIKDAEFTIQLYRVLMAEVSRHTDLMGLYDLEMKLCQTLLRMTQKGMALDVPYLETTARAYARKGLDLELRIKEEVGDQDFNPGSWQQIQAALSKRGLTVESTEAAVLAGLGDTLADGIVELREVRKIHGTYLLNLLEEQRDGVAHANWRRNGTRTGRMSSGSQTG